MRLFVAIDIPEDVRSAMAGLVSKLRPACRNARWVRIGGLHITLKFIGERSPEECDAIQAALASIPPRAPISITFRGLGFFPDERRPHILWAGIKGGTELAALVGEIETALTALGIPRDEREFSAHLTLARLETPRIFEAFHDAVKKAGRLSFGRTTVEEFHLYQSVLKPGGSEYTRLATFSLAGSKPE
jgi:2'-5' RNA ligase